MFRCSARRDGRRRDGALGVRRGRGSARLTKSRCKSIAPHAEPFNSIDDVDLGPLLERIGDARIVLLGEATHGTSEFYRMRERISRELIVQKGLPLRRH